MPATRSLPGGLTWRQAEVLGLLAQGRSNRDIASTLDVSVFTVRNHLANSYIKLNLDGRRAAVAYSRDHGLDRLVSAETLSPAA